MNTYSTFVISFPPKNLIRQTGFPDDFNMPDFFFFKIVFIEIRKESLNS